MAPIPFGGDFSRTDIGGARTSLAEYQLATPALDVCRPLPKDFDITCRLSVAARVKVILASALVAAV